MADKLNTKELYKEKAYYLELTSWFDKLEHCSDISELLTEVADSEVSTYTHDLVHWFNDCNESFDYMEKAIDEGFCDLSGYNVPDHLRMAQFFYFSDKAAEELKDALNAWAYKYLSDSGIEEVTEAQAAEIDCIRYDNIRRVDDLVEEINAAVNPADEDEE